jgi:HEAT repeat protein
MSRHWIDENVAATAERLRAARRRGDTSAAFLAMSRLGASEHPGAVGPLLEVADDEDATRGLRVMAVKRLGDLADPRATDLLTRLARSHEVAEALRYVAIESLGPLDDERALATLLACSRDESKHVRFASLAGLVWHRNNAAAREAIARAAAEGSFRERMRARRFVRLAREEGRPPT